MVKGLILAASLLAGTAAWAGEAAPLLEKHLYGGTLAEGAAALSALPDGDAAALSEKKGAEGVLAFVAGVEHLGQSLHRHGLETHPGGVMMQLPVLRMPVEPHPNPEPLDYQKWRAILQTLLADLDKADALLAEGARGEPNLPLDLMKIRLDINSDGKAGDNEALGAIMAALTRAPEPGQGQAMAFAFDKADLLWLRGYIHFLTASLQFGLAMDFEDTFNKTGHAWFPRAGLPLADELLAPAMTMGFADNSVGDAIALIHLMNWDVVEPDRLKDARVRLAAMAQLSRDSWTAARAETDNDREWLPNARQTAAFPSLAVDDQTIDNWLAVMGEFESVLEGRKLMPHWRFTKGLNVKRLFDESRHMDLVLLVAGADAVPFLETGPISTSADWQSLTSAFRGNFMNYALWFN